MHVLAGGCKIETAQMDLKLGQLSLGMHSSMCSKCASHERSPILEKVHLMYAASLHSKHAHLGPPKCMYWQEGVNLKLPRWTSNLGT